MRRRLAMGLLYVTLCIAAYGAYVYMNVRNSPRVPPMASLTSEYQELFGTVGSWPFYYKYYLYVPKHYDARKQYPLVVLLHGVSRHMRGGQFLLHPSLQAKHEVFILVPIAPIFMQWNAQSAKLVFDSISTTYTQYAIDPKRIYLSGYSMGGVGTFAVLEKYPHLFAAALALCGSYNTQRAVNFPNDVPLLLTYGALDNPANGRRMIEAMQKAGKPAYYKEYPGVGHDVWNYVYTDPRMWDWLFAHRRL